MKSTTPSSGRTACLRGHMIALLLLLPLLLGGCFTPIDYGTVVTLPEGELEDPSPYLRKKGSASTNTGAGLELVVDWVREDTDLGKSLKMTVYIAADSLVVCDPKSTGTIVINDEIIEYEPENYPMDINDPAMWRLLVTNQLINISEDQPVHVMVIWPWNEAYNGKQIKDLTVEFDA